MTRRQILIVFAHPALERSRVQRRMLAAAQELDGVEVRDLYELYPDFLIDVRAEQQALTRSDVVVFQHPLYWYSSPALLKEWQDLVLEHGWAYGKEGRALSGKLFLQAVSAGAVDDSYCEEGSNRYPLRELLRPFEQTARLCDMTPLPPFAVMGVFGLGPEELERRSQDYASLLRALRDGLVPAQQPETSWCDPEWRRTLEGLAHAR